MASDTRTLAAALERWAAASERHDLDEEELRAWLCAPSTLEEFETVTSTHWWCRTGLEHVTHIRVYWDGDDVRLSLSVAGDWWCGVLTPDLEITEDEELG